MAESRKGFLPALFRRGPSLAEAQLSTQVASLQGEVGSIPELRQQIADLRVQVALEKSLRDIAQAEQTIPGGGLVDYAGALEDQQQVALYWLHPYVFTCTALIAESLPIATLRFYRAGAIVRGREELTDWDEHPVGAAFRWINGQQGPFQFWEWMLSFLQLTGDAWAHVSYDRMPGQPAEAPFELYPLQSHHVKPIQSAAGGLLGIEYHAGGSPVRFMADELLHISTFSPRERWGGQSRMRAGHAGAVTDLRARKLNDSMIRNGAHISGILESEESLNLDTAKQTRDIFERQYAGQDKAYRIAIVWNGLKFKPTSMTNQDLQYAEQRKDSREEIAIQHGIHPMLLGLLPPNYATMREIRRTFWLDTIARWGTRIESSLNSGFLRQIDPALRCGWDYSEIEALKTNHLDAVRTGPQALQGQYTVNEWRVRMLGLDPITESWADELIQPSAGGGGGPLSEDAKQPDDTQKILRRVQGKGFGIATKAKQRNKRKQWQEKWQTAQTQAENAAASKAVGALNDTRDAMQGIVRDAAKLGSVESAALEHAYIVEGRARVVDAVMPAIEEHAQKWGDAVAREVNLSGSFDVRNERAAARLAKQEQRIRDAMGKQWPDLRRSLVDGVNAGEPQAQIERRVWEFFDGLKTNYRTVARTEVTAALNGASADAMAEAVDLGVNVKAVWSTFGDAEVRGLNPRDEFNHAAAEGLAITPGVEMFVVSGEHMAFPGDWTNGASPGNTINCRCLAIPEVE